MAKYTFEIYETWKIEKSFEADTLEEAYELAYEHANNFELSEEELAIFVNNEVTNTGETDL